MRIVCDNCGAKYQISDEKVRNKVFKIRCKKCSHVIIVRAKEDEAPAAEEATRVADYPPPEAAPPVDAIWYVVLNREQQGPFTKGQIEDYFNSEQIDADAFTWCEGMSDWMRLAAIPEFAALVPASAPAPVAAAPGRAAVASAAQDALPPEGSVDMGGFPGLDADQDVIASNNSTESESLFGASKSASEDHGSPRITDGSQLRGQRNENSVLFSLDSLAAEVDARSNRGVSNTGGTEGSGLIDISALAGPSAGPSSGGFGGGGGFAPVSAAPIAPSGMSPLVRPKQSNTGKIIAIIVGVLLLIGGAIFGTIMLTKEDPKPEVAVNTVKTAPAESVKVGSTKAEVTKTKAPAEKTDKPAEKADEPAEKADEPVEKADEPAAKAGTSKASKLARAKSRKSQRGKRGKTKANAEDRPPAKAARVSAPVKKPPAKKKSANTDEVDDLLGALGGGGSKRKAPAGNTPARKKASADPLLPERLSKSQILGVVRRNSGSIRGCKSKDPSGQGGTVMVRMTIGGNGRIKAAKAKGKYGGTSLGGCVEGKVRRFKFPQFSGAPMSINMPFRI